MKIKLLTLNLHGYQESAQLEKFQAISNFILKESIDIIAFQESSQEITETKLHLDIKKGNATDYICAQLGKPYNYFWALSHNGFPGYEEGVSVISKFPITDTEKRYISNAKTALEPNSRIVAMTTVEVENHPLHIFSCHCGWQYDIKEPFSTQYENLVKFLNEKKAPCLFMGDFNVEDDSDAYKKIIADGFHDLYVQGRQEKLLEPTVRKNIAGWEKNTKDIRIDYIFATKPFKVIESKVIFNTVKTQVSDHFAVMATIEIPTENQ